MADYYYELDEASKSGKQKIAWVTSVGPAEILRGMGFPTYFPETHSAMLGTTRMATDLIPIANAMDYSPDICSYLKASSRWHATSRESKAYPSLMCWFTTPINAGMFRNGFNGMERNLFTTTSIERPI